MKIQNVPGSYPSILVHRSHFGQLAIGGAMIDTVYEDDSLEHTTPADMSAWMGSGGWNTRFDGKDHPPHLVALYAEGLRYTNGYGEDFEEDIVVNPICYAAVALRYPEERDYHNKLVRKAGQIIFYLQPRCFYFESSIAHNGVYDLKYAFDLVVNFRNSTNLHVEQEKLREQSDRLDVYAMRDWELIPKTRVPGNVRLHLQRTLELTRTTLDSQFGQGADFFKPKDNKDKKK
jgi:hypothetical protein